MSPLPQFKSIHVDRPQDLDLEDTFILLLHPEKVTYIAKLDSINSSSRGSVIFFFLPTKLQVCMKHSLYTLLCGGGWKKFDPRRWGESHRGSQATVCRAEENSSIIRGFTAEGNGNSRKKNHLCFGATTLRGVERIVIPASHDYGGEDCEGILPFPIFIQEVESSPHISHTFLSGWLPSSLKREWESGGADASIWQIFQSLENLSYRWVLWPGLWSCHLVRV